MLTEQHCDANTYSGIEITLNEKILKETLPCNVSFKGIWMSTQ